MRIEHNHRTAKNQRGVTLIIALLLLLVLSMLAAGIIFVTQSETWASANDRTLTQARYAAEAGSQATINWLSHSYTAPTSFGSYTTTTVPVQARARQRVVLSAMSGVSSNYPDSTVQSAFNTALSSQSVPGLTNATYSTYATLISMTPGSGVSWLGSGGVQQTWQITSQGTVSGVRNATVQVVSTIQNSGSPIFDYAMESTATGCTATDKAAPIDFTGGTTSYTDSYNSNSGPYIYAANEASGGGTNGNIAVVNPGSGGTPGYISLGSGGNVAIVYGAVSTTNKTVGSSCPTDGISGAHYVSINTSTPSNNVPLPWGCTTTPCYAVASPSTASQDVSTNCRKITGCTSLGSTYINDAGAKTSVNEYSLAPGATTNYGNVEVDNADVLVLSAGTYNMNSLNFAKDGQVVVSSGPVVINLSGDGFTACTSTNCNGASLVLNVGGNAGMNLCNNGLPGNVGQLSNANCPTRAYSGSLGVSSGTPITNPISGTPSQLQVVYAGQAAIGATGAPLCAVTYAPNASVQMTGAPLAYYGSIIANSLADTANSPIHYDQALQNTIMQIGPFQQIGFTWSKF
jgi:Tfp pilus assembly protein PilX